MNLQHCDICNAGPVFYQLFRRDDLMSGSVHPLAEGVAVPPASGFVEVVAFACGGVWKRKGRLQFQQPEGANGFAVYDTETWVEHMTCPEATRILREMRSKT